MHQIPKLRLALLAISLSLVAGLAAFQLRASSGQHIDGTDDLLLTGNRTGLALCVADVDATVADAKSTAAQLQGVTESLRSHPNWKSSGLDVAQPTVDSGCKDDPVILRPGVTVSGAKVNLPEFPRVVSPSKYRVIIFVLSPEQLAATLGKSASRSFVQEMLCAGDVCHEVTTGLYVSASELADAQLMAKLLAVAIGLEAPNLEDVGALAPAPKDQLLPE